MKSCNIAIVLTGEMRYLDWLIPWWHNFANSSIHNIIIINSTWSHLDRARSKVRTSVSNLLDTDIKQTVIENVPVFNTHLHDNFDQFKNITPKSITALTNNRSSWNYTFGRTLQFASAVDSIDTDVDYIFHTRWDCMIDNFDSKFDNMISNHLDDGFTWMTRGVGVVNGDFNFDDVIYGSTQENVNKCYKNIEQVFEDTITVFKQMQKYYGEDSSTVESHLVGHSQFLRHLMFHKQSLKDFTLQLVYTFFRNNNIPYNYDVETYMSIAHQPQGSQYKRIANAI